MNFSLAPNICWLLLVISSPWTMDGPSPRLDVGIFLFFHRPRSKSRAEEDASKAVIKIHAIVYCLGTLAVTRI